MLQYPLSFEEFIHEIELDSREKQKEFGNGVRVYFEGHVDISPLFDWTDSLCDKHRISKWIGNIDEFIESDHHQVHNCHDISESASKFLAFSHFSLECLRFLSLNESSTRALVLPLDRRHKPMDLSVWSSHWISPLSIYCQSRGKAWAMNNPRTGMVVGECPISPCSVARKMPFFLLEMGGRRSTSFTSFPISHSLQFNWRAENIELDSFQREGQNEMSFREIGTTCKNELPPCRDVPQY